jgi:Flp pilus assembly protein TadG
MLAKNEKGQALVEFTLVLPLLLLLVFGIVEFGRVYSAVLAVNHVARETARAAAVGVTGTELDEIAEKAAPQLPGDKLAVNVSPSNPTRGEQVSVEVETLVDIRSPFINRLIPNPFPVRGKVIMRVE